MNLIKQIAGACKTGEAVTLTVTKTAEDKVTVLVVPNTSSESGNRVKACILAGAPDAIDSNITAAIIVREEAGMSVQELPTTETKPAEKKAKPAKKTEPKPEPVAEPIANEEEEEDWL